MLEIKNYSTVDNTGKKRLLTMASGPVIIENGKVMLVKHGEDLCWKFPGGTMTQHDSLRENAKREVMEELNIEIELGDSDPFVLEVQSEKNGVPLTIILFHYYAKRLTATIVPGNDIREYGWHDISDLPSDCAMNVASGVAYFREKGFY